MSKVNIRLDEDVLKTSKDEDERRLQDVFIKSNVCWVSTNLEKTVANITSSDSHFIVI